VTGSAINASLAIDSAGTIYFGSGDKKVYAINPDGTRKWE
jgi:outer membrane protein assembly factor BamB